MCIQTVLIASQNAELRQGLRLLPESAATAVRDAVHLKYSDSLYTSTSAVCVTGLIAVDAGKTFTPVGQFFLALLIQIGGLGITFIGAGIHFGNGQEAGSEKPTLDTGILKSRLQQRCRPIYQKRTAYDLCH